MKGKRGRPATGLNYTNYSFRLDNNTHEWLAFLAKQHEISLSNMFRMLVRKAYMEAKVQQENFDTFMDKVA